MAGYVHRVFELYQWLLQSAQPDASEEHGQLIVDAECDAVAVENVALRSPDGRLLQQHLTFTVPLGSPESQSLLISGPSGCGKSTLFRAVAGLASCAAGVIRRPPCITSIRTAAEPLCDVPLQGGYVELPQHASRDVIGHNSVVFLPQKPFIPLGVPFGDLLTYPAIVDVSDATISRRLAELVRIVCLTHVAAAPGKSSSPSSCCVASDGGVLRCYCRRQHRFPSVEGMGQGA